MNNQETLKAVKAIDSRAAFAPYFKARWQNMQNIRTDEAFYAMAPEAMVNYYYAYIRQWMNWATGFVPAIHSKDFFSTGLGYTVCEIFAKECTGGGYRFKSNSKDVAFFIEEWAKDTFEENLQKAFFLSNAGGNAFLCLTPNCGELDLSVIPINRIYFEIGRGGKVTKAMILNRFVAGVNTYYTRENRVMLDGVGYYRVELVKSQEQATSPSWGNQCEKSVPEDIEEQWFNVYGKIEPNKWYELPKNIRSLGLYNIRNKSVAIAIADMPGYSDSTLHTALDVLYSIDYNYTQQQLDQYFGKSRVLLPKQMQRRSVNIEGHTVDGVDYREATQAPLTEEIYSYVVDNYSIDGKPIQPIFLQPELRGEIRRILRDTDLELLASKVGLSSSTLANHLTYNTTKTATEVHTEQDTTEESVGNKRRLANKAINMMLADVAAFYGFADHVTIQWNRESINTIAEIQELRSDVLAGLMPRDEYWKRRWPDLTEEDIKKWGQDIDKDELGVFHEAL